MKSPEYFLAEYWQKRPVMMQNADEFRGPVLSADEVAWLALQEDVESRLIFTERRGQRTAYRLEHGPFSEAELSGLPDTDWTLLIQDVDKHLPEFREWFDAIAFIPDWRIDDLMISVAAPGGSVGPHVDNYDVFLVQVSGNRDWRTGDAADTTMDSTCEGLSLLAPFDAVERWYASPGDVLYLPPGVPHWGIAMDLCTTCSIGMRAPSRNELLAGAARVLGLEPEVRGAADELYADDDLSAHEARPGEISAQALRRLARQALPAAGLTKLERARVLGAVVTDPKAWLMPEPIPANVVPDRVHGMARLAWSSFDGSNLVFVNGAERTISAGHLAVFRNWCESRLITAADLEILQATEAGAELFDWCRLQGLFDERHSEE